METIEMNLLGLLLSSLLSALFVYTFFRFKTKSLSFSLSNMRLLNEAQQLELRKEKQKKDHYQSELIAVEKENIQLTTELKNTKQRLHEELENEQKHAQRFENIAHRVLKTQAISLNEYQSRSMKEILNPLQDQIKHFESKIDLTNKESIARHSSLKEQIVHLSIQSGKVAQDANNLAKALKGDFKKQGNWGELILESILDKSGLEKDREYSVQVSERDDIGNLKKPDVVINLPDQKKLIIDSKVSLIAYDNIMSSDHEEEINLFVKAHTLAVKKHIVDLSSKNYHDLYSMESPDFVLMFIPIDTAFGIALKQDANLYSYAFDRNIVIVTPSTLLATLKTVETMWRNDKQNRYALEIANEAGKMYDKFVGFVDDMEKIGSQLNTVQKTYHSSMSKLSVGPGNVIKKAEKIKTLGAKANKYLAPAILQKSVE